MTLTVGGSQGPPAFRVNQLTPSILKSAGCFPCAARPYIGEPLAQTKLISGLS